MARRTTSTVLVGRAIELERLETAFGVVRAGCPAAVFIGGEAGVGKSRLVAEFTRAAASEATVLCGICVDEQMPYLPVAGAVRSLFKSGWTPSGGDMQGWRELDVVVPELTVSANDQVAGGSRSPGRLRAAFLYLLEDVCRCGPVIMVIEDLQWSDASTRGLLMHAIRAMDNMPLLIVGTYRTDDLTRDHPLRQFLAEAARLTSTDMVQLERLDSIAVGELLVELLGSRPLPETVTAVFELCGGNPFLVEESIAAGSDGRLAPLSARLQSILLARTATLSPAAADVLRAAAVGGSGIGDALLRRVCAMDSATLDRALRELLDCHILEASADHHGYAFRHALTAAAVYAEALPGERVRLHSGFATAIEADPELATGRGAAAAVERAQHWYKARNSPKALPAWIDAATASESIHAYPEALAAYEIALELWPTIADPETLVGISEVDLLRRAAEAAHWAVEPDRAHMLAASALELIDERADPGRASLLAERLGRYSWAAGREHEAMAYYERAVELADAAPISAERARALAGHAQILMLNWRDAAAAERAGEAIEAARAVGAIPVEAHALSTLALARASQGDEAGALRSIDASATLTEVGGDDDNVWRLWVNRVYLLFALGHLDDAAAAASRGRGELRNHGLTRSAGAHIATNEALALVDLGRWSDARAILDDAIDRESSWWLAGPLQTRTWLNWLTGDIAGAERDLDALERLAGQITEGQYIAMQAQIVAAVAIETERWEAAVHVVVDALRDVASADRHGSLHWESLTAAWLGLWAAAELVHERGDAGTTWLVPHLAEFDRMLATARTRSPDQLTSRDRALLALCTSERARVIGECTSADWQRTVDAVDALGAVGQRAYARLRFAQAVLEEGGSRSDASHALQAVINLLADAPQSPIRTRAERLAHRSRLAMRSGDTDVDERIEHPFGLTEREMEVLQLLTEARTNREIGDVLFISPKTVSVHVSSVMRKLGVRRRADAARLAARLFESDVPL